VERFPSVVDEAATKLLRDARVAERSSRRCPTGPRKRYPGNEFPHIHQTDAATIHTVVSLQTSSVN